MILSEYIFYRKAGFHWRGVVGEHGWAAYGHRYCHCRLYSALHRKGGDDPRDERGALLLRNVSEIPADPEYANPGRSCRSAFQLQRKAFGEDPLAAGGVWQAGRTGIVDSRDYAGDSGGNDWDNPLTRQLLYESLPQARLYRIQRAHPRSQVTAQCGSARLNALH